MRLCLPLLAALTVATPAAAALSPAERKIVATVECEYGRMARAELEPLGFEVRWVPMRETGRAGHLIATHKGDGHGKRMLLIGHLDTVFEPDSPFQHFTRKPGVKAEGPGASVVKGGDAVMIAALRAMQAAGTLAPADITIVLT